MVGRIATLGYQIAIVFQHVEFVIAHQTLGLAHRPRLRGRISDVNGLAFELFGLPTGG